MQDGPTSRHRRRHRRGTDVPRDPGEPAPRGAEIPAERGLRGPRRRQVRPLRRRTRRPARLLGRAGPRPHLGHAVDPDPGLERAPRSPGGSSTASSTSPTTAWTGTSRPATATGWRSTSRASPATPATVTYADLQREVCQAANALTELGVGKGDRVAIYLPMIPEAAIAMLACARIGAPHSVVFGGFSAEALRSRIDDAEAKLVITADGGYRRGAASALKPAVDEAVAATPVGAERARRAAHRAGRRLGRRAATSGGTTSSTTASDRAHRRADGQRAPAVHPLHLGHHREAEGHPAHHRRLPDPGRVHAPDRLRPAGPRPTSSGAPPTSAGSPGTATSSTGRWPTAPPR